jgi:hypothetical protein
MNRRLARLAVASTAAITVAVTGGAAAAADTTAADKTAPATGSGKHTVGRRQGGPLQDVHHGMRGHNRHARTPMDDMHEQMAASMSADEQELHDRMQQGCTGNHDERTI